MTAGRPRCDANASCQHAPCFQVQLDARPGQAHRRADACAYHVPDVIQALRAWAAERDLADGQLTILAIEPVAGARVPGPPGDAARPGLRSFAFSTIPLGAVQPRDPEAGLRPRAAPPPDPEPQPGGPAA